MAGNYWLMKSEPDAYSLDDLQRDRTTYWDGVRNYQARNFMRDRMKVGDLVFFYHSNAEPSGIAGIAEVVKGGYPDPSVFERKSKYFDPEGDPKNPTWYCVEIKFLRKFDSLIPLDALRKIPELKEMALLRRGQRLSVQPVTEKEWKVINELAEKSADRPLAGV